MIKARVVVTAVFEYDVNYNGEMYNEYDIQDIFKWSAEDGTFEINNGMVGQTFSRPTGAVAVVATQEVTK